MISILIPVYNYDVTELAKALHDQGQQLGVPFEILVFDDGSNSPLNNKNELLNRIDHVCFKNLDQNVGLSQNRNLLAEAAKFENLLFIDGDSLIPENFLQNYLNALDATSEVIYGGRRHPKKFQNKKESLRWKYGTFVEDKSAAERSKSPYECTLFNNTLIKKEIFNQVQFERKIKQYGHEDTLFAFELKKRKIKVQHIQNPVVHNDIDPNKVFLKKTQMGLDNLKKLCDNKMLDRNYVKISRLHHSLKKTGLHLFWSWIYSNFEKRMRKNLISQKPSLFVFTVFKLSYFCKINR